MPRELRPHDGSTPNYYTNHGCRCELCKAAWANYCRNRREKRGEDLADNTNVEHGVPSTYGNYGCRCQPCTKSWSAATAERTKRRKEKLAQERAFATYEENLNTAELTSSNTS